MCILIHNPNNTALPASVIKKSLDTNRDGYGRIDLTTGKVFRTMDYKIAAEEMSKPGPAVHHCRIGTMGLKAKINVHPQHIAGNWWLLQNGTVNGIMGDKDHSDTRRMARMLRNVHPDYFYNVLTYWDSKFAIVNNKTMEVVRVNDGWTERDGVHYSHSGVLPGEYLAVYGTMKKGGADDDDTKFCDFIGDAESMEPHRLCADKEPVLIEGMKNSGGRRVQVEIYEMTDWRMREADKNLKDAERRKAQFVLRDGTVITAWTHFFPEDRDAGEYFTTWTPPARTISYPNYGAHSGWEENNGIYSRTLKVTPRTPAIRSSFEPQCPMCLSKDVKKDGNYWVCDDCNNTDHNGLWNWGDPSDRDLRRQRMIGVSHLCD